MHSPQRIFGVTKRRPDTETRKEETEQQILEFSPLHHSYLGVADDLDPEGPQNEKLYCNSQLGSA